MRAVDLFQPSGHSWAGRHKISIPSRPAVWCFSCERIPIPNIAQGMYIPSYECDWCLLLFVPEQILRKCHGYRLWAEDTHVGVLTAGGVHRIIDYDTAQRGTGSPTRGYPKEPCAIVSVANRRVENPHTRSIVRKSTRKVRPNSAGRPERRGKLLSALHVYPISINHGALRRQPLGDALPHQVAHERVDSSSARHSLRRRFHEL